MADEDINKAIKIIASTSEGFAALEKFRESLPYGCKEQIESVGTGFAGFEIRYRTQYGKSVNLPKNPRQISYDGEWMRVYYEKVHVMVPYSKEPISINFIGD